MKIGTSLASYPVFPDWIFEGQLELDDGITSKIISDLHSFQKKGAISETTFGWLSTKNIFAGSNVFSLNKLTNALFYDNATSHFRLGPDNSKIELTESWAMGIKPSYSIPVNIERHRWYQSVLFLQTEKNGSNLFLDQFGSKLYSTPIGVQPYTHYIEAQKNKIVFFPAHIPWGFTPNLSGSNTIVVCSSFIINKS